MLTLETYFIWARLCKMFKSQIFLQFLTKKSCNHYYFTTFQKGDKTIKDNKHIIFGPVHSSFYSEYEKIESYPTIPLNFYTIVYSWWQMSMLIR